MQDRENHEKSKSPKPRLKNPENLKEKASDAVYES